MILHHTAHTPAHIRTLIAIAVIEFGLRSTLCENCGRKLAVAYKFIRGKSMKVCSDCFDSKEKVQ